MPQIRSCQATKPDDPSSDVYCLERNSVAQIMAPTVFLRGHAEKAPVKRQGPHDEVLLSIREWKKANGSTQKFLAVRMYTMACSEQKHSTHCPPWIRQNQAAQLINKGQPVLSAPEKMEVRPCRNCDR